MCDVLRCTCLQRTRAEAMSHAGCFCWPCVPISSASSTPRCGLDVFPCQEAPRRAVAHSAALVTTRGGTRGMPAICCREQPCSLPGWYEAMPVWQVGSAKFDSRAGRRGDVLALRMPPRAARHCCRSPCPAATPRQPPHPSVAAPSGEGLAARTTFALFNRSAQVSATAPASTCHLGSLLPLNCPTAAPRPRNASSAQPCPPTWRPSWRARCSQAELRFAC